MLVGVDGESLASDREEEEETDELDKLDYKDGWLAGDGVSCDELCEV